MKKQETISMKNLFRFIGKVKSGPVAAKDAAEFSGMTLTTAYRWLKGGVKAGVFEELDTTPKTYRFKDDDVSDLDAVSDIAISEVRKALKDLQKEMKRLKKAVDEKEAADAR